MTPNEIKESIEARLGELEQNLGKLNLSYLVTREEQLLKNMARVTSEIHGLEWVLELLKEME